MKKYKAIYDELINIDKKLWLKILADKYVTTQSVHNVLDIFLFSKDYTERAGIVAKKLKYKHCAAINWVIVSFASRILRKYPKINAPIHNDKTTAYFHVVFLGETKEPFFYWTLRPELVEAMNETGYYKQT